MNQGFAPSNTLGVAGYVNGEGAKVGHRSPYYRPQRLFFRQTIDLGGGDDAEDPGQFDFGGKTTKNRLVITLGKFSLTDVVDDNAYAHDPQNDFLNWAIIDTGTFDYAADAWGFSYGGMAEWYQGDWTLRGGVMALSLVPNQAELTPWFRQFQPVVEVERRQKWLGREGKIKLLAFVTDGRMGRFDDAIALGELTGQTPDTALVRRYATRSGISLNLEQPVSAGTRASTSHTSTPTSTEPSPQAARSPAPGGAARTTPWRWRWWSTAFPRPTRPTWLLAALASWSAMDSCRIRAPKPSSRLTTAWQWSKAFTSPWTAKASSIPPTTATAAQSKCSAYAFMASSEHRKRRGAGNDFDI
jgi:hypothetical protein